MFASSAVMRQRSELPRHLSEALAESRAEPVHGAVAGLRGACLIGADLRVAAVRVTGLGSSLVLPRPQPAAARGDASTAIPAVLSRPPARAPGAQRCPVGAEPCR